jgi:S1-C subfamily serine protease
MRKLTATLCLMIAVFLGSEVRGSDLPPCRGSYDNCFGTYTFGPSSKWAGDKYVGEFRDNKMHGQGTYTHADGNKYVGEFRDGKSHGQGIYTYADGTVAEGIWKNNEFQYAQKVSPTRTVRKSSPPPKPDLALAKRTQEALQVLEIYSGKIDGIIGVKTRLAIRGWQTRNGYPATGAIDQTQIAKLEESAIQYLTKKKSKPKQVAKRPSPKKSPPPSSGSTGSGFFVSKLGHIVTNEHVVRQCGSVTVGDNANKQVKASVLETDKRNDLALLRISSTQMASAETKSLISKLGLKLVPLASEGLFKSDDVELGEDVLVAGYPYGELFSNSIKVTKGIVSSNKGMGDDRGQFQMDAAVQPGNSGGPIYDENGNIVGVVVAQLNKLKVAKAIGSMPENVNFGIKASTVRQFLTSAGLPTKWSNRTERKSTKELAQIAKNQTVMVVCNP